MQGSLSAAEMRNTRKWERKKERERALERKKNNVGRIVKAELLCPDITIEQSYPLPIYLPTPTAGAASAVRESCLYFYG